MPSALLLRSTGIETMVTSTLPDARVAVSASHFDVVLLDLCLGEDDGLSLLQTGLPRTRVVVVTGWGSIDRAVRAMRLGAADFVEKPLVGDELLTTVREQLGLAPDRRPTEPRQIPAESVLETLSRIREMSIRSGSATRKRAVRRCYGFCRGSSNVRISPRRHSASYPGLSNESRRPGLRRCRVSWRICRLRHARRDFRFLEIRGSGRRTVSFPSVASATPSLVLHQLCMQAV